MNADEKFYYGWIPLLTNGIKFDYGKKRITDSHSSRIKWSLQTGENEKHLKDLIASCLQDLSSSSFQNNTKDILIYISEHKEEIKRPYEYFWRIIFIDAATWEIPYFIITKKKEEIKELKKEDVLCVTSINFLTNKKGIPTGLLKIFSEYISECADKKQMKENLIREVYFSVKGIYHSHTHHSSSIHLLDIVKSEDQSDAIKKIIGYFEGKIISYHHEIRLGLFERGFKYISEESIERNFKTFTIAEGEMIYAQRFIELHDQEIQEAGLQPNDIKNEFKHAIKSIRMLEQNAIKIIESWRNKQIRTLTVIGAALALIMIFLTIPMTLDIIPL